MERLVIIILIVQVVRIASGNIPCGKLEFPVENLLKGENNTVGWAAMLFKDSDPPGTFPIPGIIVSPSLIYLSANYFEGKNRPNDKYFAVVGTPDYLTTPQTAQRIPVSFFIVHPNYKNSDDWRYTINDYALAHLAYPMNISASVQPVCFPSFMDEASVINSPGYGSLYVAGWTKNYIGQFRAIRLEVLGHNECRRLYIDKAVEGVLRDRHCGSVVEANENGACVHRDIGTFFLKNESFYFGAQVGNFYSNEGVCSQETVNFIWSHDNRTHEWIGNSIDCGLGNFTCFSSKKCITGEKLCDGTADCEDNSDELELPCRNSRMCLVNEFQCKIHGYCVPRRKVRDGFPDCPDGEDELPEAGAINITLVAIIGSTIVSVVVIIAVGCFLSTLWKLKLNIRDLNESEMNEFFKGEICPPVKESGRKDGTDESAYITVIPMGINNSVLARPWMDEYEIPLEYLEFEEELGRGQYGVVFKCQLRATKKSVNSGVLSVAVKTQLKNTPVDGFINLLREIKMTAHVGAHPAVVSFIGACTQNIKKREVYLIEELCVLGDLQSYLQKQDKEHMQELFLSQNSTETEKYSCSGIEFCINDLTKWAYQIASGMVHLGKKHVIHGDLAARNVLLNGNLDAKISDFGLSRELINDTDIYVKTSQQRVPLKWLALESITRRNFSEKSDVWAYGVTLWEIFSLGGNPYGEIICKSDFVVRLQRGYRLAAPPFASGDISRLMLSTWEEDPDNRPTFESIEEKLSCVIKNICGRHVLK